MAVLQCLLQVKGKKGCEETDDRGKRQNRTQSCMEKRWMPLPHKYLGPDVWLPSKIRSPRSLFVFSHSLFFICT